MLQVVRGTAECGGRPRRAGRRCALRQIWRSRSAARLSRQFRNHFFQRRESRGIHQSKQPDFQMQARIGLAAQVLFRDQQNLKKSRQVLFRERGSSPRQSRAFFFGRGHELGIGPAYARDQQIAKMADGLVAELLQILSLAQQAMYQSERSLRRMRLDRGHQFVENFARHHAQQFAHLRFGNARPAEGARLLQKGKRHAHAAIGGARHHSQRARLGIEALPFVAIAAERVHNFTERQRTKMKMLRARADRIDQILRLRRGHNEDDFIRRLLQCFQQRVRGLRGEHVRFVEQNHFVAPACRRVTDHVAQLANLVDAAIGCSVDLEHVERIACRDFAAGIAFIAGSGSRTFGAVKRLRKNSRRGGLAHAARAGKNVRVRHAPGADGVLQRAGDMLLPGHIGKRLWAPFPRNDLIAHECFCAAVPGGPGGR